MATVKYTEHTMHRWQITKAKCDCATTSFQSSLEAFSVREVEEVFAFYINVGDDAMHSFLSGTCLESNKHTHTVCTYEKSVLLQR